MASQNPEDWEFSLVHLPDHPIQLSQLSKFKRRMPDEAKTSECRVQPHSGLDLNKVLPLPSLNNLQPDARVLIIILKAVAMIVGGHQMIFVRCFQNINEGQIMSHLFNEESHHLWIFSRTYDLHCLLKVKLS
jgi:hypothetical protein